MLRIRHSLLVIVCAMLAITPVAHAQVTTGGISGTVTAADGSALPGVTIEAVHVPTGTVYTAVTGPTGTFLIPNVRVGGPYRVTASLEGFRPFATSNVNVALGTTAAVPVQLQLASVAEAITVTADADPVINPNRTGSTSAVSEEQIESLPTVNRNLQDFARTNPYFNVDPGDESGTRMSVAGRNNRYNTIQIDGAVNNDLFGLADTGTPGGQADAPAISLDAIEQIQMVVSPYDVRQGGFTGGGINVVTRSGANDLSGSLFYSKRDEQLIGEGPFGNEVDAFDSELLSGRLGGRIVRDRLFYFLNGESNAREEANGVSAEAGNVFGVNATIAERAQQAQAIAQARYGYNPGSLGDIPEQRDSTNFFGRLDWNIGSRNQLTLRHNYVDATRDVVSDRFSSRFRFPNAIYAFADETNSTVAQLNTAFSGYAFNEARVNMTTIRDARAVPTPIFPSVEIGGRPRSAEVILGTERFSGANSLDQDILAITNDFTWIAGTHSITIGTHNEIFDFKNLFMSDAYGYYFFPDLAAFEAGNPSEYSITVATGNDPRRPTSFDAAQYGLYISDAWAIRPDLTLTLGLRGDMPRFGTTPSNNPVVQDAIGFRTAQTPSEDVILSPRFGFNWQLPGEQQLRGGIGVFAGRAPYVWISNVYGNTGVEQQALSCAGSCNPTFVTDPFNQPTNFPAGSGAFSVDLIDPDFQLPRVLRSTLGYDRELFFGIRGTIEGVWSRNLEDVYYQNVNKVQTGTSELDGRPTYSNVSSGLRDAILMTNTDKGEQMMASLQLNKSFGRGFTLSASYAWQDAKAAFEGTSSRAISNWQFWETKGDIFEPELSRSQFETEHRINAAASWRVNTGVLGHTIAFYYNAQSGDPYSILIGSDINRDGYSTNDLLFVPNNVILCPSNARTATAASPCGVSSGNAISQLDANRFYDFLESAGIDDRGRTLDRFQATTDWSRQLDFHYELGLPVFGRGRTAITADVLNVLNMIDSEYGNVEFVAFDEYAPVAFHGIAEDGTPIYRERFNGSSEAGSQFSTANLRSRWQARLGLRLSF